MALVLIPAGVMVCDSPTCPTPWHAGPREDEDDDRDRDSEDTPETPLDEPKPPRVEEPPGEPDEKGPYVVKRLVTRDH